MNISEVRQRFPQYDDLSDEQLAKALHGKFYSDLPYHEFAASIGLNAQPSAAEEVGPVAAGVIAAGRTLDRLGKGAKQMALQVPAAFGSEAANGELARISKEEAENTRLFEQLSERRPVATLIGGAAPLVAAPVLGSGIAGMAAGAAIPGLLEYGTPQERLTRGALGAAGGAAGAVAGKALSRLAKPVRELPDAARADAIAAAQRIGYKVPVGQQTGSRAVQTIEQQLAKNPVTASAAQRVNAGNQAAVNRAVARAMGENADSLTDDVLSAAQKRIGQQFDDIAARNTVDVSQGPLLNRLVALDTEQQALGSFADPQVTALVDKGLDLAARGKVDGKTYQFIRSELGRKAESAFNGGNSSLGAALRSVKGALDDAANASISKADRAAWSEARSQWRAFKIASKRMGVVEGGNVSPARLATRVDKSRGDIPQGIRDVAKIGETFKPLPDSGTAGNSVAQMLLTGGAGLLGPGPLATMFAAPMAAQKFLQSGVGQRYLTQGAANVSPEVERFLMLAGSGLLGAPASR
jgi:hypothetical protein